MEKKIEPLALAKTKISTKHFLQQNQRGIIFFLKIENIFFKSEPFGGKSLKSLKSQTYFRKLKPKSNLSRH